MYGSLYGRISGERLKLLFGEKPSPDICWKTEQRGAGSSKKIVVRANPSKITACHVSEFSFYSD